MASAIKPGVIRVGTAKELADIGYVANGASEHSRNAAHSVNIKTASYVVGPGKFRGPRSHGELIAENAQKLAALHMSLRTERDPELCKKLQKNIDIKSKFLE